jgi:hypothetical protein
MTRSTPVHEGCSSLSPGRVRRSERSRRFGSWLCTGVRRVPQTAVWAGVRACLLRRRAVRLQGIMPKGPTTRTTDTPEWQLSTYRQRRLRPGLATWARGELAPPPDDQQHGIGGRRLLCRYVDNCHSGVSSIDVRKGRSIVELITEQRGVNTMPSCSYWLLRPAARKHRRYC